MSARGPFQTVTLVFAVASTGCHRSAEDLWTSCAPCKAADFVPHVSLARDCGNSMGSAEAHDLWRACVEGAVDAGVSFRAAAPIPGIDSRIDEVFGRLPDGQLFYVQEDSSISGGAPFFSCEGAVFSQTCDRFGIRSGWEKTPFAECLPERASKRLCYEGERKRPSLLRIATFACIAGVAGIWLWQLRRGSKQVAAVFRRPNFRLLAAWAIVSATASVMGPAFLRIFFALGHHGIDLQGEAWLEPMVFCAIWAACLTTSQLVLLRQLGHLSWLWIPVSSVAWTFFAASSHFFETPLTSALFPTLPGLLQCTLLRGQGRRTLWWVLGAGFGTWCWALLAGRLANFEGNWLGFCGALALASLPYSVLTGGTLVLLGGSAQSGQTNDRTF